MRTDIVRQGNDHAGGAVTPSPASAGIGQWTAIRRGQCALPLRLHVCGHKCEYARFGGIGSAGNRVCRGTDAARKASMRKIRAASLFHCRRNGHGGDPARICARPSAPQESDSGNAWGDGGPAALRESFGRVISARLSTHETASCTCKTGSRITQETVA